LDAARTGSAYRGPETLDAVIAALTIGDRDLAARIVDASTHPSPFYAEMRRLARALVAEANGDPSKAATEFRTAAAALVPFSIPMHTQALLGRGRCLVALGRPLEAFEPLTTARDLAVRMGARPWVTEADTLLARLEGIETPAG